MRYTTIQNWSTNVYNLVTQTGESIRKRHNGMGGCQSGIQSDHEISILLFDGTWSSW